MVNMSVGYVRSCYSLLQLQDELQRTFGSREQNKGFISGYPDGAVGGGLSGHYPDHRGVTYAYDIGVDIEGDGTGLKPSDARWLANYLATKQHPKFQYLIYNNKIRGNHTDWARDPYIGNSPHEDHIHISVVDLQWGEPSGVSRAVTDSRKSWGVYEAYNGNKPERPAKNEDHHLQDKPSSGLFWEVESGDTLSKIAKYYAVEVSELTSYNAIDNPNIIRVGDYIEVPPPLYWTWENGDSIEGVASYYGMTYDAVEENAGLVGKAPVIGTTSRIY